jgi:hypothetical protein
LIVLTYTVSIPIQPLFKLNIHNQCLNVDLVSPTYATGIEIELYRLPDHKVCAGNTTRSSFIICEYIFPVRRANFDIYGILIYRLQRKELNESTEVSEDMSSAAHLLVVWEVSESDELYADVLLVEYAKGFDWNEDGLKDFYRKSFHRSRLCPASTTETWPLDDNVALMTAFEIMNEECTLNITISEVERDNDTRMLAHIEPKRQVGLEMMIVVTMLMYIVSLELQLPMYVTIHNRCLNTELVSPVYVGNGAVCPKLSSQQMGISAAMRASFEINATQDEFEGVLIYKLQRYSDSQHNMDMTITETNKNEEKCVQMLIAWKVKNYKPFLHVTLAEHAKEFTWNESELRKFHDKNRSWLKEYDSTTSYPWFMNDNMALKTVFRVRGMEKTLS